MIASSVVQTIHDLVSDAAAFSDAELLRRFAALRDDGAFAILVRRHGPMVFGVCRRTLGHVQDAEDAFQATFLVLARKANSVRANEVSRFLYGVAVRVAKKARTRRARMIARQEENAASIEPAAANVPEAVDWLPLFDSALARLPDRDRWPILLCDVQGRSRSEAAAELGIAEGTLSSRLARSRAKLRARLIRLGVTPTIAAFSVVLAPEPVPAHLLQSTVAVGAPAAVHNLAEGVLRAMILAKSLKAATIGLLAAGALTIGFVRSPGVEADSTPAAKEAPKQPPAKVEKREPVKSDAEHFRGTWKEPPPLLKPEKREPARPDVDRFRGTWIVARTHRNGNPADKDDQRWNDETVTFDGEHVKFSRFPGRQKLYKLDPGWDQKRIDFEFRDVPDGSNRVTITVPSIYRFEGSTLHIVFGVVNLDERPVSFEVAREGPPFTHVMLARAKVDESKDPVALQRKALDGTWQSVAMEVNGERRTTTGPKITFKGNRFKLEPQVSKDFTEGEYNLDVDASPKHIDLTIATSPAAEWKGKILRGIYALDRGLLVLSLDEMNKGRPASFSEENRPVMFFVPEGTAPKLPSPKTDAQGPTRLRQLQQERIKALKEIADATTEKVYEGRATVLEAVRACEELATAELELATTSQQRVKILENLVNRLKAHEMTSLIRIKPGEALPYSKGDEAQVRAARLKAEIELEIRKAEK